MMHLIRRVANFFAMGHRSDGQPPRVGPSLSPEPDLPHPFGYKSAWFAVKSEDTSAIFEAFQLTERQVSNWQAGIGFSYDMDRQYKGVKKPVFVAPPVEGWTLVLAGLNIVADSPAGVENVRRILNVLSECFGEAHYYGSYRVVGYVAWFRSIGGEVTRGFSFADGTLFANDGQTTQAELDMGCFDMTGMDEEQLWEAIEAEEEDDRFGFSEDDPMELAGVWSVNPLALGQINGANPGTGLAGLLSK